MTDTMIEATAIEKVLGEGAGQVNALKNINVSLVGGELTLLMGPSGSGKSTLLSVLGCMLTPTSGNVRIRGRSTTGLDPEQLAEVRRENVGFVFQSYHLFPTLTAAENVRLALDVRGDCSPNVRVRADKALATVGLAHKANAFPRELSGGEQQRVAIARAIVGEPSVILADEPTAALDSENGHAVMMVLAEIAKDPSRALFIVTHDPRIMRFADRILRIEDGRIVDDRRRNGSESFGTVQALKFAS
jgi:putative ABC transport system ATP-binding protein